MDDRCASLCNTMARLVVTRDFGGVHALLAPWLRPAMSPEDIERMTAAQSEGLAHPPHSWTIGEGLAGLEDLRTPDPYGPPSNPLPAQITPANFRGWLHIQFLPDPAVHDEQNVCYDLWLAAVEEGGTCLAGYVEAWEPT